MPAIRKRAAIPLCERRRQRVCAVGSLRSAHPSTGSMCRGDPLCRRRPTRPFSAAKNFRAHGHGAAPARREQVKIRRLDIPQTTGRSYAAHAGRKSPVHYSWYIGRRTARRRTMRHVQRSILPLLVLALAAPLCAADQQLLGSLLEKAYKGQNMLLRTSTSGATIRYSADGRLIKGGQPGPWTLDADIRCTGVELKRNELVIKGKRLYFLYDEKLKTLRPWFGPGVAVEIALGHDTPSLTALQQEIGKVFVAGSENPVLLVPDYWKDYLLRPTRQATAPPPEQMSAVPLASMQKLAGESKQPALPMSSIYEAELV